MPASTTASLAAERRVSAAPALEPVAAPAAARVHVCHVVLELRIGGAERLVESMLRAQAARLTVSCICLDRRGTIGEALAAEGFTVHALDRRPGRDWSVAWRIAEIARREGIDILHCHQYTPFFYGALSRLKHRRPRVIFTEHGGIHKRPVKWSRRLFNTALRPWTSAVTAVSPAVAKVLHQVEWLPRQRTEVIGNGVDPRAVRIDLTQTQARQRLGLDPQARYLVAVASFRPIKGFQHLIDALARVRRSCPDVRLLLVGDGPERPALEEQIRQSGLQDHVVMPGFRDDIAVWLRAADIFVLSSLSEATPVSLIEAMGVGLPAVVTDVGGNPHVLRPGVTGELVPAEDADALARALVALLENPQRRRLYAAAARETFDRRHHLSTMLGDYASLYRRLLGLTEELQ